MISENQNSSFPDNVIRVIEPKMVAIDTDMTVVRRPLRPSDPNQAIGLFPTLWMPNEESYEIGHSTPHEPTIHEYQIGVQGLIKHGDEVIGLSIHSLLAMYIRRVLYKDQNLRNDITSLVVASGGLVERTRRWTARLQRYMNDEVEGQFVFVSTCEVIVETEIT